MSFTKSLLYSFLITCIIIIILGVSSIFQGLWFLFIGMIPLFPLAILIHVIRLLTAILNELKKANK